MSAQINSKTAAGLFGFCDYMVEKGYATTAVTDPWKTAARKVLGTVFGEGYESTDLTSLDLEDVISRFETKTLGAYKHDSVVAYGRRLRNAVEAYLAFVDTGKPPQLRRPSRSSKAGANGAKKVSAASSVKPRPLQRVREQPAGELIQFPFPLRTGEMAQLHLPRSLRKEDADRLSAFLRTLQAEPQKELPERAGEEAQAA
ncbi:MAG TPA: hypothetical protein VF731_00580 [Solirubrobacterales bacterium]